MVNEKNELLHLNENEKQKKVYGSYLSELENAYQNTLIKVKEANLQTSKKTDDKIRNILNELNNYK